MLGKFTPLVFCIVSMLGLTSCAHKSTDNDSMQKNSDNMKMDNMKMDKPTTQASAMHYTCTMHPEVVTDAPGKCPKCGMELVAKK